MPSTQTEMGTSIRMARRSHAIYDEYEATKRREIETLPGRLGELGLRVFVLCMPIAFIFAVLSAAEVWDDFYEHWIVLGIVAACGALICVCSRICYWIVVLR